MKKFLLSIVALVLLGAMAMAFVACSNVNQINFIHVVARDKETMTYTIQWVDKAADTGAETTTDIGTMTMQFRRLVDKDVDLNGNTYHIASGGMLKTVLDVTDGDYAGDSMQATVLFENAFSPIASSKTYVAAGDQARSYTSAIDYTAKKSVQIEVNGKTSSFKKPNYCYDNDSLYFLARGSDMGQASYSLSVAGVDNLQGGTRTVSLAKAAAQQSVQVPLLGAADTYMIRLTTNTTYGNGTYSDLYFLPTYQYDTGSGTVDINKLLLRIDEGHVRYVLRDFALE